MFDSVRFIQFGDVHLGTTFRGSGFGKQIADQRSSELMVTFRKALQTAVEQKVDFILITGDLFEGPFVDESQLQEIRSTLKSVVPVPVLITPGNHDPLTADSPYRRMDWGAHVHVFGPQLQRVELVDGRCGVWGYGYPSSIQRDNPYNKLQLQGTEKIEIVAVHGSVDGPEGTPYLPLSTADIRKMGADYTALAHYHTKEITWEDAGRVRAAYAGSLEPLGFDEPGEHGAFLVEASKGGANVTWLPLAKRSYQYHDLDVTGCESVGDITRLAAEQISTESWKRDLHRVRLLGTLDAGVDLEQLRREWIDSGFWIQVENAARLDYDLEAYTANSLHGRFIKLLQERIASETDSEQRQILEMALTMGLDALTYGRVISR